jgi:hypothetical protein
VSASRKFVADHVGRNLALSVRASGEPFQQFVKARAPSLVHGVDALHVEQIVKRVGIECVRLAGLDTDSRAFSGWRSPTLPSNYAVPSDDSKGRLGAHVAFPASIS